MRKNEDTRWSEDFAQGMDTKNEETWDVLETQLYVILPL